MKITNFEIAFALTLIAGLSTGIGSLVVLSKKSTNKKFMSVALGFSAGIMIYISFVEILTSANKYLVSAQGFKIGSLIAAAAFFGGILLIAVIDKLVPEYENPHEMHTGLDCKSAESKANSKMMKVGVMTAIAITIHNIPEGLATFASAVKDPKIGLFIAFAVAIHNIPEGIAVAVPIFCSTGKKRKAFLWSFASGLTEVVGALLGCFIFLPFLNDTVFGIIFAVVAGIMVFISFDELLPAAREYGEHHLSIYGLILGMAFMASSLILLK